MEGVQTFFFFPKNEISCNHVNRDLWERSKLLVLETGFYSKAVEVCQEPKLRVAPSGLYFLMGLSPSPEAFAKDPVGNKASFS